MLLLGPLRKYFSRSKWSASHR